MNKLIGLMFTLVLILSICACGAQPSAEQKAESDADAESANIDEVTQEEKSGEVTQEQIEEGIIGSWIVADLNDQPALTNEKSVFTFVSPVKAYIGASFNARPELGYPWLDLLEADVDITGNKVTLTRSSNDDTIIVDELFISNNTDAENQGSLIVKSIENGEETIITEDTIRLVKVSEDYSEDILGTWEGRCTSESSAFDDGQDHRWEYKNDGTFVYYVKDGDNWVPSENESNEYFVAGNLLCTRWFDGGTEYREWWEITIDGDTMSWAALREGEDGKTYTATFEMNRVTEDY